MDGWGGLVGWGGWYEGKKSGVIGPKEKNDDDGRDPPPDHAARGW